MKDYLVLQIIQVHFLLLEHVGISLYGSSLIGFLLLLTHILGCLTVGILFRFWKKNYKNEINYNTAPSENKLQNISVSNLGEVLGESITSAISTTLLIGGFVVLFSVIISILNNSGVINILSIIFGPVLNIFGFPVEFSSSLVTGLLEITNGLNLIAGIKIKQISLNIIFSSFLLGFGGISVLFQVLSVVSKSDLSIKPYIIGKILHGFISAFYTFLMIQFFPIFNFNL